MIKTKEGPKYPESDGILESRLGTLDDGHGALAVGKSGIPTYRIPALHHIVAKHVIPSDHLVMVPEDWRPNLIEETKKNLAIEIAEKMLQNGWIDFSEIHSHDMRSTVSVLANCYVLDPGMGANAV